MKALNEKPMSPYSKPKLTCFLTILSIFIVMNTAQAQSVKYIPYFKSEFMLGKIVKTNSFFPETDYQKRYLFNIGRVYTDTTSWPAFFGYPEIGIGFSYNQLGHKSVFGNSYGLLKYIEFRPGGFLARSLNFHIALGASWFDSPYHPENNPVNKAIGSHLNWAFRLFAYYNVYTGRSIILRFGGGYLHSSNGHVQLPNFGLNSGALSLSVLFTDSKNNLLTKLPKIKPDKTRSYIVEFRRGFGFHALGGTAGPADAKIKPVHSNELSAGIIFRQYLKFYGGFTQRNYRHFADTKNTAWLQNKELPDYYHCNTYFFLGLELLTGQVGIDIQGGLTIRKPFYADFDEQFQKSEPLDYWLKYLFPTRLGLKYYWLKNQYRPKNNFYLSAAINANFGEADFTEFSIGYRRLFNKK